VWSSGHDHIDGFGPRRLGRARRHEVHRIHVDAPGDPLDRLQGQVALATLQAAHVGAVDADDLGESLLRQTASLAVRAQVAADGALEIPFHDAMERRGSLLLRLQTDKSRAGQHGGLGLDEATMLLLVTLHTNK
jgi:hypothetical protein